MNEVIYLIVYGVNWIYYFIVIVNKLQVWVRDVNMSFKQVL